MTARKTATKAVAAAAVAESPPVVNPPSPPEDSAPQAQTAPEPVYIAARRMQRNGEVIKIGDVLPDAATWPRLESWIRAGYVKEAS